MQVFRISSKNSVLRRPRHALVTGVLTQPTGQPIYRSLPMMMALILIIMGIPKNYYIKPISPGHCWYMTIWENHLILTLYKEYNMTRTMPRWRRTMARRRGNACRKNFLRSNGDSRTTKWNGSGWVRLSFLFSAICSYLDLGYAWYQGLSSLPWCFVIEVTMPEKCNDK